MEGILDKALRELAPEEQEQARHAIWVIQQSGLFVSLNEVIDKRLLAEMPSGDWIDSGQTAHLAGEMVRRGFILDFTEQLTRLGIPPGERVIPKTNGT